jgi:Na+/H+ antiporter NhaD/arsenite permease-like protein
MLMVMSPSDRRDTWLAIRAGQLSKGRPLAVVVSLAVTTAVLSAFLDNLHTVLLMVPITFLLADALDIDPSRSCFIEIIVSNIGGTATLIGDPPNILIAGKTDLSFMTSSSTSRRSPRWRSSW